jgi:hypothetical protein
VSEDRADFPATGRFAEDPKSGAANIEVTTASIAANVGIAALKGVKGK